jgi:Common central domain of tyrosinase
MRVSSLAIVLAVGATGLSATIPSSSDSLAPVPTGVTVVYDQRKWPLLEPSQALSSLYKKAKATPTAVSILPGIPVPSDVANALASAKAEMAAQGPAVAEDLKATTEATANNATSCTNPEIHREWRSLTLVQQKNYVNAMKCLTTQPSRSGLAGARNRWDDLVVIHQQMSDIIHNVGQFLPWHRYFLKMLEMEMRRTCGYKGPMAWWDETRDAGNFHSAPVSNPQTLGWFAQGNDHCEATGVSFCILLFVRVKNQR